MTQNALTQLKMHDQLAAVMESKRKLFQKLGVARQAILAISPEDEEGHCRWCEAYIRDGYPHASECLRQRALDDD